MSRLSAGLVLATALLAPALVSADAWLGEAPVTDQPTVSVSEALDQAAEWIGKPVQVSGRVTDVCSNRGCWAVLTENEAMLRVKVPDHAWAIPNDYRGSALAHGVIEEVEISSEHARHLVEDDGADSAILDTRREYRLRLAGLRLD